MVTYPLEAINAILFPVRQVPGQRTFHTLWKLYQDIQECLRRMEHLYHPYEGYDGYMMTQDAYELYSATRWQDLADIGNNFIVPVTAITDTDQKSEERKWQARKKILDT